MCSLTGATEDVRQMFFEGINDSFESHIHTELEEFEGGLVQRIHLGIYLCQNIVSSKSFCSEGVGL